MRRKLIVWITCLTLSPALRAASVDGIELYSESAGRGPTIIFVHGWTCDTSSWREQVPAFAKNYRVITLDLPGHGRSESPAADGFSMALFARAVDAVRAEAGADKVVLVGHSMGVVVLRQYAIMFPEHVAGLVAVDGPLDLRAMGGPADGPPASMTLQMRENMIRGMFVPETPEALQAHILEMMLGTPEATANGAAAAMFDPAIRTPDVIDAPTLDVVAGSSERPDMAALREVVPRVEAVRMAGTGHFLMMEKPDAFNELLEGFLDDIGY